MVFGRPLLADSFTVVDPTGQAVPPGVAGELHLVRRLAGNTDATRTLARWRSDGVLQCLGELDSVAYVEGRRVALDQFAERINALPGVEVAAVSVRDDAALHRCLVVGMQLKSGVVSDTAHWEAAVHALIPGLASMRIHIGPLARLPNGSIDMSAITSRRRASGAEAELLTPTQRTIAEVWQSLLGLTDVGLQDNFFDLGGTSLGAMQAAHRLEQRLGGRRISPRRYVFETLAQIAAAFDDVPSETEVEAVVGEPVTGEPGRSRTFVEKLKRLMGGT